MMQAGSDIFQHDLEPSLAPVVFKESRVRRIEDCDEGVIGSHGKSPL